VQRAPTVICHIIRYITHMSYVTTLYTLHLGSVCLSNIRKQHRLIQEVNVRLHFLCISCAVVYTRTVNASIVKLFCSLFTRAQTLLLPALLRTVIFSRPYWVVRSRLWYDVLSVCRLPVVCMSVTFCIVAKRYVVEGRRWYRWIGSW